MKIRAPFALRHRWSILCALVVLGVGTVQAATGASAPGWIVFSALPNGLPPAQLFRIETTGGGLQQITRGSKPATAPAFSPNGRRVAFARLGAGIYAMNIDGSGVRRLTSGATDVFPVWSPDGGRIAFLRQYRTEWRLYVMKASGRAPHRLRLAPPAGRPSWAADGKSIFIPTRGALAKIDARTGRMLRYVQLRQELPLAATLPPSGARVAFVGPRPSAPGCGEVSCLVFALYLGDVSTGRVKRFVNDGGPAGWSPDAKRLAFVYRGGLALWPVEGGNNTKLVTSPHVAQADSPPAWQPR